MSLYFVLFWLTFVQDARATELDAAIDEAAGSADQIVWGGELILAASYCLHDEKGDRACPCHEDEATPVRHCMGSAGMRAFDAGDGCNQKCCTRDGWCFVTAVHCIGAEVKLW